MRRLLDADEAARLDGTSATLWRCLARRSSCACRTSKGSAFGGGFVPFLVDARWTLPLPICETGFGGAFAFVAFVAAFVAAFFSFSSFFAFSFARVSGVGSAFFNRRPLSMRPKSEPRPPAGFLVHSMKCLPNEPPFIGTSHSGVT